MNTVMIYGKWIFLGIMIYQMINVNSFGDSMTFSLCQIDFQSQEDDNFIDNDSFSSEITKNINKNEYSKDKANIFDHSMTFLPCKIDFQSDKSDKANNFSNKIIYAGYIYRDYLQREDKKNNIWVMIRWLMEEWVVDRIIGIESEWRFSRRVKETYYFHFWPGVYGGGETDRSFGDLAKLLILYYGTKSRSYPFSRTMVEVGTTPTTKKTYYFQNQILGFGSFFQSKRRGL